MQNTKPVNSPLVGHHKLSEDHCPTSKKEKEAMKKVPYQSAMGSLMYAMVCTRPDLAYAVGVVSRFMSNPGEAHWAAVKWILRISEVLPKCVYVLEMLILYCMAIQMQIMLKTRTLESPHRDT